MVDHAWHLIKKYDLNNGSNKVYVDASQPGFIRSLKNSIGEFMQYEQLIEKAKKNKWPASNYMNIVPVSFGERHRLMLANVKKWIDKRQVAIDPSLHSELLTDLRIAESDEELSLNKKDYSMDMLDAFRLSLDFIMYVFEFQLLLNV